MTGGEPSLWPHLNELIEHAFSRGWESVLVNTNAMQIADEQWKRLSEYRDRLKLTITLNGPKEIHEKTRGNGTHERTVAGIHKALECGIPVELFTVVISDLLEGLAEFISDVFRMFKDIRSLTFIQLHRVPGDFYDVSNLLISPEEFLGLVHALGVYRTILGHPLFVKENPLALLATRVMEMPPFRSPPLVRPGRLLVFHDGRIALVHSIRKSYGVYKPGLLKQAFYSEDHAADVAPDERVCPACEFFRTCREYGMVRPSEDSWYVRDGEELFCKAVNRILFSRDHPFPGTVNAVSATGEARGQ